MRNLRHLVIYSRWYLEDIEIYKKLISAWENNNILRRVDIYTTTPIINAYLPTNLGNTSTNSQKKSIFTVSNGINDINHNYVVCSFNFG